MRVTTLPPALTVYPFSSIALERRVPRRAEVLLCVRLMLLVGFLVPFLATSAAAVAGESAGGPSVAQLVATCERGTAAGDLGVDAAMCEWYAVPCDCVGKRPNEPERWCMPDDEPVEAALAKVLAELRRAPVQSAPAETVVADAMARLYPCAERQGR